MTDVEKYVARVVDSAPPLTAEQRDKLAELLRPVRHVSAPIEDAAVHKNRKKLSVVST